MANGVKSTPPLLGQEDERVFCRLVIFCLLETIRFLLWLRPECGVELAGVARVFGCC